MPSKDDIFKQVCDILEDLFEVDPQSVSLQSALYEDLDIDSIDAVDMMVKVKEITGKRLDPEEFKDVRTIQDCVDAIADLYARLAQSA
jgi:acyl carrier protein